jgi:hypothetical protein
LSAFVTSCQNRGRKSQTLRAAIEDLIRFDTRASLAATGLDNRRAVALASRWIAASR